LSKYIAINHNGRIVCGPSLHVDAMATAKEYTFYTGNAAHVITVAEAPQYMNEGQMREAGI
jgi:hypothetical protein